jgi:ankyrin repeat protein
MAPFSTIKVIFNRGGTIHKGQLLHYAAMRLLEDRVEVLKFLFSKGLSSVNNIMYQDRPEAYIQNMYSGLGTPLHFAAGRGLLDVVELLIERGADPRTKDPTGMLAVDWANYRDHQGVAKFLQPLSVDPDASLHGFTDAPGRHLSILSVTEYVNRGKWHLV